VERLSAGKKASRTSNSTLTYLVDTVNGLRLFGWSPWWGGQVPETVFACHEDCIDYDRLFEPRQRVFPKIQKDWMASPSVLTLKYHYLAVYRLLWRYE
jgi:hypothetical protein